MSHMKYEDNGGIPPYLEKKLKELGVAETQAIAHTVGRCVPSQCWICKKLEEVAKGVWTTKNGKKISVKKMTTEHIYNALRVLRERGYIGPSTLRAYLSTSGPQGEIAQMAFEQELLDISTTPVSPFIDYFEEELEERAKKCKALGVPTLTEEDLK